MLQDAAWTDCRETRQLHTEISEKITPGIYSLRLSFFSQYCDVCAISLVLEGVDLQLVTELKVWVVC